MSLSSRRLAFLIAGYGSYLGTRDLFDLFLSDDEPLVVITAALRSRQQELVDNMARVAKAVNGS
jgi:hypothetical protein